MPSMTNSLENRIYCQKVADAASIKKLPWMGSTLTYVPFRVMIKRLQMLPYHNKLLVMVGLILKNSKRSIELLGEDGTDNLVRECHLRERELAISSLIYGI